MAQPGLLEVYKAIGELTRATQDMRDDVKDIKENQEVAVESRQQMVDQMTTMGHRMSAFEKQLNKVSAVTDKVTRWEQRGIGALAIVGFGSSAVTWGLVHWSEQIVTLLSKKVM